MGGRRGRTGTTASHGSCHDRALRLLAVRPRTRGELRERLLRAGFDPAEVHEELDRLERVGLLDDARFAREFAEREVGGRLAGSRAVGRALAAKGVARPLIEEVVGAYAEGDEDRAVELARSRAPRLAALGPEAAFRRLVSLLSRRGYEPAVALRAARVALGLREEGGDP
ncbi:MAG TPA: regulatory protein RecX [Actinomycetota bacterium]|nr:regulatory protein RecX [Actinomycetota bacterium]